jgi:two-component system sensor histidine kinase YesM
MQITSIIYTDTTLKSYLTKKYQDDYDFVTAYQYINRLMYSLLLANNSANNISIYTKNFTLPSDGKFIYHITESTSNIDWLVSNLNHGYIVYNGTSVDTKGNAVFSVGRALNFNNENYTYAYLVIDIPESVLYSQIENEFLQKDFYITDENGVIISTRNKELLSSKLEDVLGVGIFSQPNNVLQTATVNNEKVMIVYTSMTNGWKTVTVIPINSILSDATKASSQIAFISILCVIISILLLLLISRHFSRRLKVLNKQISMIADNNFSYQAKNISADEMGQLSNSINIMARRLDEAINEAYKKEILRKRAELNLLQSQINPHFLYNTLAGISSLAFRGDSNEVGKLINHLSQFYKISLHQGKEYISIGEEVKITKHYVALQNMRFKDMFLFHWDVDEALCEYQTLKLMLQPFIENAVNHAIRDDNKPLNVSIRIFQSDEVILFEVEDDGIGIHESVLKSIFQHEPPVGYGICNVNNRIKLSYGEEYGIYIISTLGKGTKVTIKIPKV